MLSLTISHGYSHSSKLPTLQVAGSQREGLDVGVRDLMETPADDKNFWRTFSRALGADSRDDLVLRGASGLDHSVQAVSVDDKNNRVILVSAEASPRAAALMQFDIQQTMPSTHVLVARPLVVDLGQIARTLFPTAEAAQLDLSALQKQKGRKKKLANDRLAEQLNAIVEPVSKTFKQISLPALTQITGYPTAGVC
jgi:hypothetical protein